MGLLASCICSNHKRWAAVFVGVILLLTACFVSTKNYLLFHTFAEIFTIIICFTIALIVFHNYKNLKNNFIPIIGISYTFAGLFDLLHTLAFKGVGVFPNADSNLATQMWIIARYLDSIGMLAAGVSFDRTIKPSYVLITYAVVAASALVAVFHWQVFPVCFIEGLGLTSFKIYSEYIISLILIASVFLLMRHKNQFHPKVYWLLLIFFLTSIGTELTLTLYQDAYGLANLIGHLFKVTAFFFLYRAIVETSLKEPFNLLFFQLNQANDLLKANERKLLAAQQIARVGFYEWDLVNDKLYWSDQMYTNMGYIPQEVTPTAALFLGRVHPDDREYLRKSIIGNRKKESGDMQIRMVKPDGSEGWLHNQSHAVLGEQGNPIKVFGTVQDITERKRSEAQLEHYANELTATNKELKSYAYSVAHDFRAPLVNLKGFSGELEHSLTELKQIIHNSIVPQNFQSAVSTLLEKEVPEALGFIHSSVDKMDRMIVALLKLSRFGRRELNYEEIDMKRLVSVVLQSFKHKIEQQNIQVTIGLLPQIKTDQLAMEQIISNLLDNAIKYLEPGRRGEIGIYCTDSGDGITFYVQDNGRGIAAADQAKIFEIFQRVGKLDVAGEGMGLAYVKNLVRQLGGKVSSESELGVGTKISFTIS